MDIRKQYIFGKPKKGVILVYISTVVKNMTYRITQMMICFTLPIRKIIQKEDAPDLQMRLTILRNWKD